MPIAQIKSALASKILWRFAFWSGLLTMEAGTFVVYKFANNVVMGQVYLFVGFTLVILGIALIGTSGWIFGKSKKNKNLKKVDNPNQYCALNMQYSLDMF